MKLRLPDRGSTLGDGSDELTELAREIRPYARERAVGFKRLGGLAAKLGAAVVLAGAAVWAYQSNASRPGMDMSMRITSGATPFPVALAPVERGAITGTVVYTGSVAPFNEEDIYPRVTGRIVAMPVYPGDAVRAGQVVARLDDVELSSRVREAEAMAVTAEASRSQMEADLVAAQHGVVQMEKELAMVEAELVYAQAVRDRSERLVNSGAISRQEYENDRSMAASLDARRDAARAKLEQARAMEVSAKKKTEAAAAMVAQGRAAARTAQVVRDYVTIVAPSAGYVAKRLVAPGVLVEPGMAILKIAQLDRVRLQANVGERDVASIRVGSPVTVTAAGAVQAPITARVTAVFPFVDQGPRTAVVEAVVQNPGRRFLPGQYVVMQFQTGASTDALTVPHGAVVRLGGKAKVWTVQDGRAEAREVTTGLENPERIEITRGLTGNETVIGRGHESLYAGARVSDVSAPAPATHEGHAGMPGMTEPPSGGTPAPAKHEMPAPPIAPKDAPSAGDGAPVKPGEAPHADHRAPASAKEESHAGHGAPATPQEESHTGHGAPARSQEESHVGHGAPATPQEESHTGHGAPAKAKEEPHAGHEAPATPKETPHAGH